MYVTSVGSRSNATLISSWSFDIIGVNRNFNVTSIESDLSSRAPSASAAVNRIFSISCIPHLSREISCDSISVDWFCSFMVVVHARQFLRNFEFSKLGEAVQAPEVGHRGGHALNHFQRHFLGLHVGRCARMHEGRRPHHQGEDNLLSIQMPCFVEIDAEPAAFLHLREITAEKIAFPGATICYRYRGRKRVSDITRPVSFAQTLPVTQS